MAGLFGTTSKRKTAKKAASKRKPAKKTGTKRASTKKKTTKRASTKKKVTKRTTKRGGSAGTATLLLVPQATARKLLKGSVRIG